MTWEVIAAPREPFDSRSVAEQLIKGGFAKEQVLEVIAIVAAATISNYAGTIVNPLEERITAQELRVECMFPADAEGDKPL